MSELSAYLEFVHLTMEKAQGGMPKLLVYKLAVRRLQLQISNA